MPRRSPRRLKQSTSRHRRRRTSKRYGKKYRASSSLMPPPPPPSKKREQKTGLIVIPFKYVILIHMYFNGDFRRYSNNTKSGNESFTDPSALEGQIKNQRREIERTLNDRREGAIILPSFDMPWPLELPVYSGNGKLINYIFCAAHLPLDNNLNDVCTKLDEYNLIQFCFDLDSQNKSVQIRDLGEEMEYLADRVSRISPPFSPEIFEHDFEQAPGTKLLTPMLLPIDVALAKQVCSSLSFEGGVEDYAPVMLPPRVHRSRSTRYFDGFGS